mgnify:CR=1 FL=1
MEISTDGFLLLAFKTIKTKFDSWLGPDAVLMGGTFVFFLGQKINANAPKAIMTTVIDVIIFIFMKKFASPKIKI